MDIFENFRIIFGENCTMNLDAFYNLSNSEDSYYENVTNLLTKNCIQTEKIYIIKTAMFI